MSVVNMQYSFYLRAQNNTRNETFVHPPGPTNVGLAYTCPSNGVIAHVYCVFSHTHTIGFYQNLCKASETMVSQSADGMHALMSIV